MSKKISPYPGYDKLKDWVQRGGRAYSQSLYTQWFSFQDFPWSIYDWRNEIQKRTKDLNDNFLQIRYLSFAYAKPRKDLPRVKFSDKDACYVEFEVIVKSNKKLNKYIEIVKQIMGNDITSTVTGEFCKDAIGQRIIWKAKASDVIAYVKEQFPEEHGISLFKDYCEEYEINMNEIDYII